jgi:hypothetical protein
MNGSSNVPLTVVASQSGAWPSITIGTNASLRPPDENPGELWLVVIDRTTLNVAASVTTTDFNDVPAAVQPYAGNVQYMLIAVTMGMTINQVPQGALYQLLVSAGADDALSRLEQINLQLSCGDFNMMSYALVGVFGQGTQGFEDESLLQVGALGVVLTLQLMPTVIQGQTWYTPIEL